MRLPARCGRPLFGSIAADDVPIGHVTNGAHLPTFLGEPMGELLGRHLGEGWDVACTHTPRRGSPVAEIPNEELWRTRCEARKRLLEFIRAETELDQLLRGEQIEEVRAVAPQPRGRCAHPRVRAAARYVQASSSTHVRPRIVSAASFEGANSVQLLIAGKAHPNDEDGKGTLQRIFQLRREGANEFERLAIRCLNICWGVGSNHQPGTLTFGRGDKVNVSTAFLIIRFVAEFQWHITAFAGSACFGAVGKNRNIYVLKDERPSNRSKPLSIAIHVSCTTSSATAYSFT